MKSKQVFLAVHPGYIVKGTVTWMFTGDPDCMGH